MKISKEISGVNLASAIRALRETIGLTQEGMARELECTLSGYRKWESGVALPGGGYLIRMLQLCPDAQTLAAFGITVAPRRQDGYYKLRGDLEAVIASGKSQLINQAEERLDHLAEQARIMTRKARLKQ